MYKAYNKTLKEFFFLININGNCAIRRMKGLSSIVDEYLWYLRNKKNVVPKRSRGPPIQSDI